MKVLLILCDGMRPDAIADNELTAYLQKNGTYSMGAQTVMPSVTLPCHMSLFHSVDPSRHGITTNTYTPQVRPIAGLFDVLSQKGLRCAMFYNWEQLRDLGRPGSLCRSELAALKYYGIEQATRMSYAAAKNAMAADELDFVFLYLGWSDEAGHAHGWLSPEYCHAVEESCRMVKDLIEEFGDQYTVIFTADHGGHDRSHGTDSPEDMTIPMFFLGAPFEAGKETKDLSIKDIAPTVANLFGARAPEEWEGKVIL